MDAAPGAREEVRVWDLPVRLFHWALATLVVFSYVTAKVGGSWLEWHMRSGYTILTLLLFRFAWGLIGSDTARFGSFLRGPRAALEYLRGLGRGARTQVLGHNPMGGWAAAAMLAVLLVQAISGLFVDDEIATQGPLTVKVSGATVGRMTALHSYNEWAILALVGLHLAAIATYRFALKADLVGPMVHGRMALPEGIGPPRMASGVLAAVLFALAAGVVYWLVVIFPRTPA